MTTASLSRSAGILLHPTSLPGPFGIGDLGPTAFRWVETLAAMRQSWWQVLPLGPAGGGGPPFQFLPAVRGKRQLVQPGVAGARRARVAGVVAGQQFPHDHV